MSLETVVGLPTPALVVDGQQIREGQQLFEHLDPATGKPNGMVPMASIEQVDAAVLAAHQAFDSWRRLPGAQRARLLFRLAELMEERAPLLAEANRADNGAPKSTASNMVAAAVDWVRYYAGWADKLPLGRVSSNGGAGGSLGHTLRQPYGVIGAVITWNAPVMSLAMKVPAALAAGNTMVIKPSELTPFTPTVFAQLVQEAGIPDGVINIVTGGAEAGAALVEHPLVKKITFTGGPVTARAIARSCAETFKPMILELGGKSANIVFDDADLEKAAGHAAFLAFGMMSGQACALPTRLLVQRGVYEQFIRMVQSIAESFPLGDPAGDYTLCGPVVSQQAIDRIQSMVAQAHTDGARLVTGGKRAEGELAEGYFYPPTIFADVDPASQLAQEEVFGPVLAVIPFEDEAEALALANDTQYGLSGYVWTADLGRGLRLSEELVTGEVAVNGAFNATAERPFGGIGHSGIGNEGGLEGLEEFFWTKSVGISTH
ncbi:aldehyde dehydrogenase family protein [Arthrobacter sp. MYb213]|uniref:aldehyde dehydrogenase family protein n=1 Tax=Arthrobacter sp. MYb213 TaxID=1848595 RepID=UPI000CFCC4ED|nr:aldehyde dehydrogenase family protein [Arthrobacter sp. MYb213]PRB70409.1 aldehyde dehydrogenase [Arthrobacter sp. MYb213]